MDILFGNLKLDSKSEKATATEKAPIEMMSDFLVLVSNNKMKEALALCNEILKFEPNNKMLLDYKTSLTAYIKQGLDDPPSAEQSEAEESDQDEENEGDSEEEEQSSEEESVEVKKVTTTRHKK